MPEGEDNRGSVMDNYDSVQLSQLLDINDHKEIITAVESIYCNYYPRDTFPYLTKCYHKIIDLFNGKFPGFNKCNTDYHDLEHTMEVFVAAARLIDGYNLTNNRKLNQVNVIRLLTASLFHDVGYIQRSWDNRGTGAKFTRNHVERSIIFLEEQNYHFDINVSDIGSIKKYILSTKLDVDFDLIDFVNSDEKVSGAILGTSDLLGQMSNRAYLEKLLFLYYEYREAGIAGFNTEFDILKKTADFYRSVEKMLVSRYMETYKFAREHFRVRHGIDRNLYLDAIEKQMKYLDKIIEDESTNFRDKLSRKDLNSIDPLLTDKFH